MNAYSIQYVYDDQNGYIILMKVKKGNIYMAKGLNPFAKHQRTYVRTS